MLQQSLVQRMSFRVRDAVHLTVPYRARRRSSSRPSSCCTDAACASPAVRSVCLAARGTARPTSDAHSTAKAENCQGNPTYSAALHSCERSDSATQRQRSDNSVSLTVDAVGRPTDCFAVAQLIVLRHCGDCHSGDAAARSVPLRAPRPAGLCQPPREWTHPAH
jgi:hypothetical protein